MFMILKKTDIDSHELYSLIIPPMINYKDKKIEIVNGKIKSHGHVMQYT